MNILKDLIGYEGYYKISNRGYIVRLPRLKKCNGGGTIKLPKLVIRPTSTNQYPTVMLNRGADQKSFQMHRLMAIHFVPNDQPLIKREVNHKNRNKSDYSVKNLEWCTKVENGLHFKRDQRKRKEMLLLSNK